MNIRTGGEGAKFLSHFFKESIYFFLYTKVWGPGEKGLTSAHLYHTYLHTGSPHTMRLSPSLTTHYLLLVTLAAILLTVHNDNC